MTIYIFNCRLISFLIFRVMIICLKTECASSMLETWLCSSFFISKIHDSAFSLSSLTMMKKKHLIRLFELCRWCSFVRSWDFLSRSQIIHVLHLTFNLNFLIRFKTTAYSSWLTCSFRYLRRSFKFSKMRAFEKENKIIASRTLMNEKKK